MDESNSGSEVNRLFPEREFLKGRVRFCLDLGTFSEKVPKLPECVTSCKPIINVKLLFI